MRAASVRLHAWAILGGLLATVLISNPYALLPDTRRFHSDQARADFLAFYAAGTIIREDPARLYDEALQAQVQSIAFGEQISNDGPGFMPFVYPAVVAVFFAPVSLLPYAQGYLAILAINLFLWGIVLDLACRRFRISGHAATVLALSASISFPVIFTIANGQVAFISFLLAALAVADIREGNDRSGLWVGLLAFKPTLAPLFVVWLIAQRRWRSLMYAASVGATVFAVSALIVGVTGTVNYADVSWKMAHDQYGSANPGWMPNVRTLFVAVGYGEVATIVSVILVSLFVIKGDRSRVASCAALIVGVVIFARHIHFPDLTLLWIPVALLLSNKREVTRFTRWGIFAGSIVATVAVFRMTEADVPLLSLILLLLFVVSAVWSVAGPRVITPKNDLTTSLPYP